jgi:hypothetical protein
MLPTGAGIAYASSFPPENFLIAGGRMLVPQRAFAEALGAVDHAFDAHASEYQV